MSYHSDTELARLADLRIRYLRGELHEQTPESYRLEFGRWLHENGRLGTDDAEADPDGLILRRSRGWTWGR